MKKKLQNLESSLKNDLDNFDIKNLDILETVQYNLLIKQGFTKMICLLKLVYHNSKLSYNLYQIKELVKKYELTIKL
jgi:hypothetical protein